MLDAARWEHDLHHRAHDTTVLRPALIVAPERYTKLVRLCPDDGRVIWRASVQGPWGHMAANETLAVYLNQHSLLECFDAVDGASTWTVDLAAHRPGVYQRVVAVDDVVVASGWRPVATAVRDGVVVWAVSAGEPVVGPPGTVLLPVPEGCRARLVAAASGAVLAELPYPMRASRWTGTHFVGADGSRGVIAVDLDGRARTWRSHRRVPSSRASTGASSRSCDGAASEAARTWSLDELAPSE